MVRYQMGPKDANRRRALSRQGLEHFLAHDREKRMPVFGKCLPSGLTRGIMLHQ
jgi:hypothetical protein